MKTKMLMASGFLAVAGIAIVAYAAWASSNQNHLNSEQVNFNGLRTVHHQHQLKDVAMWDTMLNQITAWAQNHESRLQARASSSADYPNLTSADTSFTHLIDARKSNGNKLTEQMWDGLQTQLSKVALNHEMRLRMQASQPTQPSSPITPQLFIVNKDALTATSTNYQGDSAARIEMQVKVFPAGNYTVQYSSSDTNVVYPLGMANNPQNTTDFSNTFAAVNYGEARICAFITYNGQKIQDCAQARVVDPNAGGNGEVFSDPNLASCQVGVPFMVEKDSSWFTPNDSFQADIKFEWRYEYPHDASSVGIAERWKNILTLDLRPIDSSVRVPGSKQVTFRLHDCIRGNYRNSTDVIADRINEMLRERRLDNAFEAVAGWANAVHLYQKYISYDSSPLQIVNKQVWQGRW